LISCDHFFQGSGPYGIAAEADDRIAVTSYSDYAKSAAEIIRVDPLTGAQTRVSAAGMLAAPIGIAVFREALRRCSAPVSARHRHPGQSSSPFSLTISHRERSVQPPTSSKRPLTSARLTRCWISTIASCFGLSSRDPEVSVRKRQGLSRAS